MVLLKNLSKWYSVNVITQTYFWFKILFCRLGSLTIPFTSVYLNGCKVEGFFKLSTPVLNLAYSAPSASGSYIWVFATLDPPLIAPPDPHADLAMAGRLILLWFMARLYLWCPIAR